MSDYDILPCAGCGEPPVDIGSFGRVKYACVTYTRRDKEKVTYRCDGGQGRPSFYLYSSAVSDWNKLQTEEDDE